MSRTKLTKEEKKLRKARTKESCKESRKNTRWAIFLAFNIMSSFNKKQRK